MFCYTNKIICSNNKNILLQQQNVWFYQQNVWLLRQKSWLQQQKFDVVPNYVVVRKPFFPCRPDDLLNIAEVVVTEVTEPKLQIKYNMMMLQRFPYPSIQDKLN